jgi:hypothetical protein
MTLKSDWVDDDTFVTSAHLAAHNSLAAAANADAAGTRTGDQTITGGGLSIATAGKGVAIKEGSNARMGVATLVGGAAVVSTTAVSASSRIQLTAQSLGTITVPAALAVTARTAATSFTITSSEATDTSVVAWLIVEPAA